MSVVCLDTSAYSHFRRGFPEATRAVSAAKSVVVPVIVLGELRSGFRAGGRVTENEEALLQFIREPAVTVADVDDAAATTYSELVADLRKAGTPVPTNDIWIAAIAVRDGATVLTYDDHFSRIRRAGVQLLVRTGT